MKTRSANAVINDLAATQHGVVTRAQLLAAGASVAQIHRRVVGHEVDFYWRAERLIVEIDGYAFHGSRVRFESDRRRDAALLAAGLRVMRVTWQQIEREPEALLVRMAQALAPRV